MFDISQNGLGWSKSVPYTGYPRLCGLKKHVTPLPHKTTKISRLFPNRQTKSLTRVFIKITPPHSHPVQKPKNKNTRD